MKLKTWNDDTVVFDDGTVVAYEHDQECCEVNWADFSVLGIASHFRDLVFSSLHIDPIDGAGFNMVPLDGDGIPISGATVFIPCYSDQNGYYSDDITITVSNQSAIERVCLCAEERVH